MGVANAIITNEDTARLAAAMPGRFDRVLVDAPCSGEGCSAEEAAATAQHNDGLVAHCAELGAEILENAAALLALAVYWSIRPARLPRMRMKGRLQTFLQSTPSSPSVTCRPADFGRPGEGNRAPDHPDFHAEYTRRIWPADGGEGHFMAKLQKPPPLKRPPRRKSSRPRR